MRTLFGIVSFFLLCMTITGCGSGESAKSGQDSADSVIDSSKLVPMDTITTVENGDTVKEVVRKFPTTSSQLEYMKQSPDWSKYQSGILPKMAEDAPEYGEKILQSKHDHFLIVDKGKMKVFLYDKFGNVKLSYPIACSRNYGHKQKNNDCRTPEGYYTSKGVYDSSGWLYTNAAGYTSPTRGVYGPKAIKTSYNGIAIHGTNAPGSIGRRTSHGCIRLKNDDIVELVKYVEAGTPIIISPGPKDLAVDQKEGHHIAAVVTEPGTEKAVAGNYSMSQVEKAAGTTSSSSKEKKKTDAKDTKDSKKEAGENKVKEETTTKEAPAEPASEKKSAPAEKKTEKAAPATPSTEN